MTQEQVQRRPHELRAIAELNDLDIRIFSLEQFINGPLFVRVDEAEQERLKRQYDAMQVYVSILMERVQAFPPIEGVMAEPEAASGDNPGPRGHEVMTPVEAQPIEDLDGFAMMVDQWHGKCMEHGNRMLNIPEGTTVQVADAKNPGELIEMDLKGAYLQTYRIGAEAVLQIFKDLPFGVSLEDAPEIPSV